MECSRPRDQRQMMGTVTILFHVLGSAGHAAVLLNRTVKSRVLSLHEHATTSTRLLDSIQHTST